MKEIMEQKNTDGPKLETDQTEHNITISVSFSEDAGDYVVAVSTEIKTAEEETAYKKRATLRLSKSEPKLKNYLIRTRAIKILGPLYEHMAVTYGDPEKSNSNDEQQKYPIRHKEKYSKWPRNADNKIQMFTLTFNSLVTAANKMLAHFSLSHPAINILTNIGGGFSIGTGLTGLLRSGYGLKKAHDNKARFLKSILRINDNLDQGFDLSTALKCLKDGYQFEVIDYYKHLLRLILDLGLIAVGILGMMLPAMSTYFLIASVPLIACLSLISLLAMYQKPKIDQETLTVLNPLPDDLSDELKNDLLLIKKRTEEHEGIRVTKRNNYTIEAFARFALAIVAICLAFPITIQSIAIYPLIPLFVVLAFITLGVKWWFANGTDKKAKERREIITKLPERRQDIATIINTSTQGATDGLKSNGNQDKSTHAGIKNGAINPNDLINDRIKSILGYILTVLTRQPPGMLIDVPENQAKKEVPTVRYNTHAQGLKQLLCYDQTKKNKELIDPDNKLGFKKGEPSNNEIDKKEDSSNGVNHSKVGRSPSCSDRKTTYTASYATAHYPFFSRRAKTNAVVAPSPPNDTHPPSFVT